MTLNQPITPQVAQQSFLGNKYVESTASSHIHDLNYGLPSLGHNP